VDLANLVLTLTSRRVEKLEYLDQMISPRIGRCRKRQGVLEQDADRARTQIVGKEPLWAIGQFAQKFLYPLQIQNNVPGFHSK